MNHRRTWLTQEEQERICDLSRQGLLIREIADEVGVSINSVSRVRRKNGLQKRNMFKEEQQYTTDLVISLKDFEKDRFAATAKFYGFNTTSQLVMSVLNEKYYEAKDEIDALSTRERLQREYNAEYRALRQKYAELFRKETE